MTTSSTRGARSRRLAKPDRRRALQLLADCPQEGCSEAIMLGHGFTVDQFVELIRAEARARRREAGRGYKRR